MAQRPITLSLLLARQQIHEPIFISVDANVTVDLIDDVYNHATAVFLKLGDGAQFVHRYSRISVTQPELSFYYITCQQESSYTCELTITSHASLTLCLYTDLQGKNAQAKIYGSHMLEKEQYALVSMRSFHSAPHTRTQIYFNTAVNEGNALFDGLIQLHKQAQHAHGVLMNKNVLLTPRSKARSFPNLQIAANQVSCRHGSAIGFLSAEHIFFLQARGIDPVQAKKLLVDAFLQEPFAALW